MSRHSHRHGHGCTPAVLVAMLCAVAVAHPAWAAKPQALNWQKTPTSVALKNGDKVVWKYNYAPKEGKPYFHPVALTDGTVLTDLRPKDHPWHRGVWFAWKLVDGVNYWEEDRKTHRSQGHTEIVNVEAATADDFTAMFKLKLNYRPPGKAVVMTEKRTVMVSAPDAAGAYQIDWSTTFTAGVKDVALERTPIPGQPGGKPWGGYAGLGVRCARFARAWQFHDSRGRTDAGRKGVNPLKGKQAAWMALSGKTPAGAACTVAVFDHPSNLRHPNRWAVYHDLGYLGTAMIHDKPYTIPAGKTLSLKYRIVILPGGADKPKLDAIWKAFAGPEKDK